MYSQDEVITSGSAQLIDCIIINICFKYEYEHFMSLCDSLKQVISHIQQLLCSIYKSGPLALNNHSHGQGSVGFHSQLKVKCQKYDNYIAVTLTSDSTKTQRQI